MASIQRYTVKGKSYWRIVESRRVNGKPRAIPILHLGTADSLLERLTKASSKEGFSVKSFDHGAVAAILAIAEELEVVSIIDRFVPKSQLTSEQKRANYWIEMVPRTGLTLPQNGHQFIPLVLHDPKAISLRFLRF